MLAPWDNYDSIRQVIHFLSYNWEAPLSVVVGLYLNHSLKLTHAIFAGSYLRFFFPSIVQDCFFDQVTKSQKFQDCFVNHFAIHLKFNSLNRLFRVHSFLFTWIPYCLSCLSDVRCPSWTGFIFWGQLLNFHITISSYLLTMFLRRYHFGFYNQPFIFANFQNVSDS